MRIWTVVWSYRYGPRDLTTIANVPSDAIIENPQIGVEVFETFQLAQKSNHINRCFPIIAKLLNAIPPAFLVSAVPRLKGVVEWKVCPLLPLPETDHHLIFASQSSVETRVRDIMRDITTYTDVKSETKAKPTIYHQILNSNLPPEELTFTRLTEDGTAIVCSSLPLSFTFSHQ